ncbi:hypothetical protein [Candidatus Phytoplasma oryzae]|uniref:hypothetical protein n=1 Tax=Candidatus Phytoplasma oryzae TaxID=203274 RepID=UPI000DCFB06A|nr:hypothetical protein [Candidatus Phytoplasma oryzae]
MVHHTLQTEEASHFYQLIERSKEQLHQLINLPQTTFFITAKTLFQKIKEIITNKTQNSF